jgi:cysteine sulfinate desulfinase/cysteine desulfurase-like protein
MLSIIRGFWPITADIDLEKSQKAIGLGDELARSTLRFGLGRYNTLEEIDYVADTIITIISRTRIG